MCLHVFTCIPTSFAKFNLGGKALSEWLGCRTLAIQPRRSCPCRFDPFLLQRVLNKKPAPADLWNVYLSTSPSPSKCRPPPAVKPIMETTSHLSPTTILDNMAPSEQHDFLKLEDLDASPPQSFSFDNSFQQGSPPPPVIVTSKQAKKRKSWGQELPEPTTTLPPRKRAKTEDEKEQRRIERIKRNRAAAHNSRERKRQETETLAVALARVQAELDAYRKIHGPLPASVVLPEVTVCMERYESEHMQI